VFLPARKWINKQSNRLVRGEGRRGRGGGRREAGHNAPIVAPPLHKRAPEVQPRNSSESSVKIGTIQRRLAWPLRKDDTQKSRMYHFLPFHFLFLIFRKLDFDFPKVRFGFSKTGI
jgi:hypothetical protein